MKTVKLRKAHEQLLREQVIDAERPGPVLHDFGVVLDFVGVQGVKAAGKYNLLPIEALAELDARLSRPLRLVLKRPQLRSHPYLWGLHLLLRASGLGLVEGTGAQARLVLDPSLLAQWRALNPTEQYFTLLEAWLRIGRAEMIGAQGRGAFGGLLMPVLQSWQHLPARGKRFNLKHPQQVYVSMLGREFYQVALTDLFGLLEVEQPPPGVTPWCPAAVRHLPFGDALLTLLAERVYCSLDAFIEADMAPGTPQLGEWQSIFQPYFPDWHETLHISETPPRTGIYLVRVALGKVWRRLALHASHTVDDLVACILKSVNFDNDHLYELLCRDRYGKTMRILHPYMEGGAEELSGAKVLLGELPLEPGQSMTLVYDFGDNWRFEVKLEAIEPSIAKPRAPQILKRHGKAPEQYPSWDE